MHVVSANLNGIRSAINKGFFDWIETNQPDIICLQETKAQLKSTPIKIPDYYHMYCSDALKKGYSGVAILSKQKAMAVETYGDKIFDDEGRYLAIELKHAIIISIYLPSGTSGDTRQNIKMQCLEKLYSNKLCKLINSPKPIIFAGDFNIAHKKIDLKNWQANQKKTGFLPEEREWMDKVIDLGWVDSFRALNTEPEQYTWWTYRSAARTRNVGWRIDYQITTPNIRPVIAKIETDLFVSDHAPLSIYYE